MNRRVFNMLAGFGAASLAAWPALGVGLWWSAGPGPDSVLVGDAVTVSPVAVRLAAQLAPSLQTLALDHKEAIVASSGGAVARLAVRTVYPAGVKAVPYATEVGCDRALSFLDGLSVAQLIGLLSEHARAKGLPLHPTLARYTDSPPIQEAP